MKKKVWAVSPFFFIITIIMFVMAFTSWFFNKTVFYVEISIAVIATLAVLVSIINFNIYIKTTVKSAESAVGGFDKDALEKFPVPIVVVGKESDIIWFNSDFSKTVCHQRECTGESIHGFIYPKTVEQILQSGTTDIRYDSLRYTVFGIPAGDAVILYFIEDTYYKEISLEYNESRPAVALILFDNREEFERDSTDGEDAQIVAMVENTLQKWAAKTSGFLKKLSGGRYLVIFEERHVRRFIREKFKILEEIREIKLDDRRWATISIGIGRNGSTLKECEYWARNALDMALGRGGDQAVVKQGEMYSFFGGVSKGTEKRSKVRTRVISSTLSDQIQMSDCVFVMGHRFSDLDSVGAAIGMCSAVLKGQKKKAYVVVNRAETLALPLVESMENIGQEEFFLSPDKAIDLVTDKTLLIIVDTHSQDFLESKELYHKCKRIVVIDHHRMMVSHIEDALVFYHEPYASSASEMVTELVQYLGSNALNRLEAESLLAGIMLDTKNFVLKTGVRTFEAAAYLRRKGADTVEVKRLFSNSIDTYKAKYQLVSGAEIFNSCAIACTEESGSDIRVASAQAADELLGIQGVKASFVIYSCKEGISISARSLGDVNVQLIMEALGGGGHQTMAGAQITGSTMEHVRQKLVELISSIEIKST